MQAIARSRFARYLASLAIAVQLLVPLAVQAHFADSNRSADAIALCTGTQTRWVRLSPEGRLVEVAPPGRSQTPLDAATACPVCAVGAGSVACPALIAPDFAIEAGGLSVTPAERTAPPTSARWAAVEARAPPVAS